MTSAPGSRSAHRNLRLVALVLVSVGLIGLALWQWRQQDWGALAWLAANVAVYTIRVPHALRNRANVVADNRANSSERMILAGMSLTMMVLPLFYLATGLFAFADYRLARWATMLGIVLLVPALWLFWRSHADLGRNWSPTLEVRDDHGLVTAGVYAHVRHPMYAAIALLSVAQPLLLHNWIAGPPVLIAFAALRLVRIPREEAMMRDRFGKAWEDYAARTGRIAPKISLLVVPHR